MIIRTIHKMHLPELTVEFRIGNEFDLVMVSDQQLAEAVYTAIEMPYRADPEKAPLVAFVQQAVEAWREDGRTFASFAVGDEVHVISPFRNFTAVVEPSGWTIGALEVTA